MPPKGGSISKHRKTPHASKLCVLCPHGDDEQSFGELLKDSQTPTHYYCLLFASGLAQQGEETEGLFGFLQKDIKKEMSRGSKLACSFCKKKGATIGCFNPRCHVKCHFGCGRSNDMLFIFKDNFKAFCADHRYTQKRLPQSDRSRLDLKKTAICYICYDSVSTYASFKVLRSVCCERHFYHRHCIDKFAYSAGIHFLRCPMCNDKDTFQAELLEFGVHIPDRDATWELEPDAYDSLLERHSRCDQESCLCLEGRSADRKDSEWELILCLSCGSQGTHIKCASLMNTRFPRWYCGDCKPVFEKYLEALAVPSGLSCNLNLSLPDSLSPGNSFCFVVEKSSISTRSQSSRRTNDSVEICEDSEVEIVVID